uniref:Trans-anol O-methyltransferase 1 n=1 Tax=Pimpinella anisum TaxID=271192 RepID=AIMT1_PIMAN|nr:RecName: Full=Trans-anol O-methyltransferase 1; Short=T-anol O-methyltransferase 1; AltName: Full=T-anol/isoeugenol O-methyltransferase 1; Short=PaAIMT1 [Pimpinella anisum]ACL13527.1 SAM:t-anol/isoeugenol O-methyltransferase [Pimpinella anisum]
MASHDQEAFLTAMQIVNSSAVDGVLICLIELNVFDIMMQKAGMDGYLHPDEIALNLPTKNPQAPEMLDRMLRILASHSIIKCKLVKKMSGNALLTRAYGLTLISQYFVNAQDGPCLAPYLKLIHHKQMQNSWEKVNEAVLEGGYAFNKAHAGSTFFEYLGKDKSVAELLSQTMAKSIPTSMNILLKSYKGFEGVKEVVDVGGAYAATLSCIISFNPHVKGINFDVPHVIKNAPSLPGITHVGGDMFESVPRGEAIVLQRVLHDWTDEESVKILKKCYEAIPDHGKVVIIEMIQTEMPEDDIIAKNISEMDIRMLLYTPGGKERTVNEFLMLGKQAGFPSSKYICGADLYGVVELYKKK